MYMHVNVLVTSAYFHIGFCMCVHFKLSLFSYTFCCFTGLINDVCHHISQAVKNRLGNYHQSIPSVKTSYHQAY